MKDFFSDERKIYDSVHGFIHLDEFEKELIDSAPFQRLHHIHQLGIAFLVYPGATHTRFEHSLGVMELATRIYHNLAKSVRPDIFHLVPRKGSAEYHYWRRVLRIAALCHDLGHLPFSHVGEEALLGSYGHEEWTLKIIRSEFLLPIWEKIIDKCSLKELFGDRDFVEDICKIAIGEEKYQAIQKTPFSAWERVISEIVTGDFFGADRMDYLLRDAKSTGVAYGLFDYHQMIEMIRILPGVDAKKELDLGINENGLESCEALLLARHFMHRRVYHYSTVKAYNFHLVRFMKHFFHEEDFSSVEHYLSFTDVEVLAELRKAAREINHKGHQDALRILERKSRFVALALTFDLAEKDLGKIRSLAKIPDDLIGWEIIGKGALKRGFNFPVSRKHLSLESASDLSDLLSNPLSKRTSWVYVDPEYEAEVTSALEEYRPKQ